MPNQKPISDLLKAPLKIEQWPIDRLIMYARNPRKNDAVVDKMVSAIKEFGFRIPIVAKSDGSVIDGHLRLKAAKKLGMAEVPVALADELTDAQVKAFRILANRSANWAEWDMPLLATEFEDLQVANFDLSFTGMDQSEIEDILKSVDINFSGEEKTDFTADEFGQGAVRVKISLSPEVVTVFEEAIEKTGVKNRMEAIKIICEAYLAKR